MLVDALIAVNVAAVVLIYIINNILKNKPPLLKNILFLIAYDFTSIINFFYINSILKQVITFILLSFLVRFIYNKSTKESIIVIAYTILIGTISELLFSVIILILGIPFDSIQILPFATTIVNVSVFIIMLTIYKLKLFDFVIKLLKKIDDHKIKYLIFIIVITTNMILLANINRHGINKEYYLNLVLFFLFLIIIIILIKDKYSIHQANKKYDEMVKHINNYEKMINEQNKICHEFKNQLAVINGYVSNNNKELKEYLKSIISEVNENNPFFMKEIVKIPSGGLKGLIYYKLNNIKAEKINLDLQIEDKLKNLSKQISISLYKDITKIVGVYLDNAIEAAKLSDKKIMSLRISKKGRNIIIAISNSYKGILPGEKIDDIRYSTKGFNRGYGLSLVKDLLIKNKKIKSRRTIEQNMFYQELQIEL